MNPKLVNNIFCHNFSLKKKYIDCENNNGPSTLPEASAGHGLAAE